VPLTVSLVREAGSGSGSVGSAPKDASRGCGVPGMVAFGDGCGTRLDEEKGWIFASGRVKACPSFAIYEPSKRILVVVVQI
jgi:hypothetical protein